MTEPKHSHSSEAKARVFFALWPSAAERRAMARWQAPLKDLCGGRAMRSDTLHVTLLFLGEIPADRLEALKLAAEEVAGQPFALRFDRARYWGHNHIAYAAPSAVPEALRDLAAALEQRATQHRFRFERRPYKPHITLLRNARWTDDPLPALPPVDWQVREFVLVLSSPDENGAHYEVLARFPLKG